MKGDAYDDRFIYKELYDLHNISCVQVSAEMYGIHSKSLEWKVYRNRKRYSRVRINFIF